MSVYLCLQKAWRDLTAQVMTMRLPVARHDTEDARKFDGEIIVAQLNAPSGARMVQEQRAWYVFSPHTAAHYNDVYPYTKPSPIP